VQGAASRCSVLQCVAVCCSVLQSNYLRFERVSAPTNSRECHVGPALGSDPCGGLLSRSKGVMSHTACCSVLQRVAVCCTDPHGGLLSRSKGVMSHTACCSMLQCVAVTLTVSCCHAPRELCHEQRIAECCSVLQRDAVCCSDPHGILLSRSKEVMAHAACCSVLQCVAMCCSVLQCDAACCSVMQRVAACCSVIQ